MTGDRVWWQEGKHYRDLAMWLREIARKCHLPNSQQELLDLARRYEGRADHMDRNAAFIRARFRTPHRQVKELGSKGKCKFVAYIDEPKSHTDRDP